MGHTRDVENVIEVEDEPSEDSSEDTSEGTSEDTSEDAAESKDEVGAAPVEETSEESFPASDPPSF